MTRWLLRVPETNPAVDGNGNDGNPSESADLMEGSVQFIVVTVREPGTGLLRTTGLVPMSV